MQWTQVDCPRKNVRITSGKEDVLSVMNRDMLRDLAANAPNHLDLHPLNQNRRRLRILLTPMHTWDPSITISLTPRNKNYTNASKKRVFDKVDCTGNSPLLWDGSTLWPYFFLSVVLSCSLHLIFGPIGSYLIWRHYFYSWRTLSILSVFGLVDIIIRFKGGHMVNTCQTHICHMLFTCTTVHYCAMLCAQPFLLYYSFLFI